MAELIHQTAPGAQLYFYSAENSEQDFAAGIQALANAGCQVIVDDITYEDEPFFQLAGPIDTAAEQVVADGVNYFSATGNQSSNFFQGEFTPASTMIPGVGAVTAEQFPGGAAYQTAIVPADEQDTLSLQWAAPYAADNPDTLTVYAVTASGQVINSFQSGAEPAVLLNLPVSASTQTYRIYVAQTPGTAMPGTFKYLLEGDGTLSGVGVGVGSGSIFGHDLVPGVNAVGAVNVANTPSEGGTPIPESYTGTGPGELLLAPDGAPLAQPETLDTPAFLAPDGASTSIYTPFLGTSAAAAEAAAVAALMLQADPSLGNADVSTLLADSAIPAGAASKAGAGLIQANLAVGFAATRDIAGSQQATVSGIAEACTVTGGPSTQEIVAGSAPALLQSEGSDTVLAGAGADTVDLLGASALLFGGTGSLLVRTMAGNDTVVGGPSGMTVAGGGGGGFEYGSAAGDNALTAGDAPTWVVQGGAADTLAAAGGGNDTLFAYGSGAATLLGGGASGNVFVALGSAADLILAGGGTNVVYLDAGNDTVAGGSGALVLQAGSGAQLVFGGSAGGNYLAAGSGAATLAGGGGGDTLAGAGAGDVLVAASAGNDTLIAGRGAEILVGGGAGTNLFVAGAADALIAPEAAAAVVEFGSGQSTVLGGGGSELLDLVDGSGGGLDFVTGFNPAEDMVQFAGYGAGAAAAVAAQNDSGGASWISLPDGTVIAFVGLAHLSAANVVTV